MTITIDPYLVFIDSIRSEFTRRLYKSLLGKFFASIPSLKGATIQEQCLVFVENARKDSDWPLQQIVGLYASIETKGRQQGGGWLYCEKLRLRAQTVL